MATHSSENNIADDRTELRGGSKLLGIGAVLGLVGLVAAVGIGFGGEFTLRRFLFGYLAGYVFVLALALGCLAFVLLQHLTRAAWSVSVRRIAENFAATLPLLGVLALPMVLSVVMGNGFLYRWALPDSRITPQAKQAFNRGEAEIEEVPSQNINNGELEAEVQSFVAPSRPSELHLDPLTLIKRDAGLHWFNRGFFVLRIVFYVLVWSLIAVWYRRTSIQQDRTSNEKLTLRMQTFAAPSLVLLGFTITGAAFDLLMSLDPHWYSTMFGVYYIAECLLGSFGLLIITAYLLQRAGYLKRSISTEHYHDLGKYLFAFTFFFGYVAFSQYMLLWYSSIPEEVVWMARHGVSTAIHIGWNGVIIAILFGHILIPFAALLSRHPKRHPWILVFLAVWQVAFVAVDMYWVVAPEMGPTGPDVSSILVALFSVIGMTGVLVAGFAYLSARASLRPTHDPRLADSLVFQNI